MFSGRLWMGSYWEPNPTPCARRWGPSVPGTPGAPDAPRAPRAATYLVICVGPASTFPWKKVQGARGAHKYDPICCPEVYFVVFFARESACRANNYDQTCCSEVYFVLFFVRESARVAHTYDPRCCPELYFVLFLQGEVFAGPTNMTQHVAPKHTVYCFFFCQGKSSRGPDIRPKMLPRSARCIVFFARDGRGGALIVPGWPPVAWGRGVSY